MKKLIGLVIGAVLIFILPKLTFAACNPRGDTPNCPRGQIPCDLNGSISCCDQAGGSCAQLPGSIQSTGTGDCDTSQWCDCPAATKIRTAIGCIPIFDQSNFLSFALKWAVGIGGGIAFLLIVYAGFMIMTSSGNPERLKAGQELLTSAISGLILLIFSVVILRIIGINILRIPGFAGSG